MERAVLIMGLNGYLDMSKCPLATAEYDNRYDPSPHLEKYWAVNSPLPFLHYRSVKRNRLSLS